MRTEDLYRTEVEKTSTIELQKSETDSIKVEEKTDPEYMSKVFFVVILLWSMSYNYFFKSGNFIIGHYTLKDVNTFFIIGYIYSRRII